MSVHVYAYSTCSRASMRQRKLCPHRQCELCPNPYVQTLLSVLAGFAIETARSPGRVRDPALVSSSVPSDLTYCKHQESNHATRECRRGSANCGWIGSLSHTDQSDHNMHGTGHAARSHPFFVLATLKYLRISHFAKSSGRHVRVCACECLRV